MIVSWKELKNRKVLFCCLKTASDGADATCRCSLQVVSDGGTRNWKRPFVDCRETNGWNFQTMRRLQPATRVKHDCR